MTFVVLAITHSGFMSAFRKFFSFSSLSFGGDGELCGRLIYHHQLEGHRRFGHRGAADDDLRAAAEGHPPPKPVKGSVLAGVLACLVGAGLVAFTHIHYFPVVDRMIWETSPPGEPAHGLP